MKYIRQNIILIITLICIFSGLSSCQSSMTPLQVSMKFWEGIKKKNISLITIYSYSDTEFSVDYMNQLLNFSAISFGRIIINKNIAEIETRVTSVSDGENMDILFRTYLHRKNGIWKVNYDESIHSLKTRQEMTKLLRNIQQLTENLAYGLEVSVEDIKLKIMPMIQSKLKNIEERLQKKMPEFKNTLNELSDAIKRLLENVTSPEKGEIKTQQI